MNSGEAIGFVQFWGLSPQLNLSQNKERNILISHSSDLRHILQTCLENANSETQLTFYVHERDKEVVCRMLLLLLVIHIENLTYKERSDLFLEIFGNTFIRQKTAGLIDKLIPFIDDLVANETKHKSALNTIVDLKELKFKDRDEMSDIVRSWSSHNEFSIEKLRDHRLRHHYGNRYDFRTNLIDWDYQMGLKEQAPIIHFLHYKEWRQTGVAFESRYASYPAANRTLSSYLPGKNNKTNDRLLVRGYWADIIISPYISLGIKTTIQPEKDALFKIRNMQQVSHSVAVSEFNIQHMIQKFDNLSEYHLDLNKEPDQADGKLQEENNIQIISDAKVTRVSTIDNLLADIRNDPLLVFQKLGVKIVPVFTEIEKLLDLKQYQGFFDAGFIGFMQSGKLKEPRLKKIFSPLAKIYVETAKYIVPFTKEEREKALNGIITISKEQGWQVNQNNDEEIILSLK